jgi:hypothetical protein
LKNKLKWVIKIILFVKPIKLLSTYLLLHFGLILTAQTIIVENIKLNDDSLGWQGLINFNFYASKNKSELVKSDLGTNFQFRKGANIFKSFNNYKIVFTDNEDIEEKAFQQFRYNYLLSDNMVLEAFVQAQTDQILRIDFRGLAGGGPKLRIISKDKLVFACAAIYMYEYEEEKDTNIIHRDHRLSLNYFLSLKLGSHLTLNQFSYYQPRINYFKDFRISSGLFVNIKLSRHFLFNLAATTTYDKMPVIDPDISNFTYQVSNGLSYLF